MPVYLVIEIEVKDPEPYARYVAQAPPIVEKYGGRYLVRGGKSTTLSGDWEPERLVVVEFPSAEDVRACFGSPEYKAVAPLREESTVSRIVMVEGFSPAE